MSFSDHKITAFTHRIADLPDQPNLPADELKARFDSSPEELRQGLNAVCDDADRLEARVEGIVVETFGDTIDKEMLSTELAAELDAKATQTALAAESTARESADSTLGSRMSSAEGTIATHTNQIAQKCEVYVGTYIGNGEASQTINIGFTPKAVLASDQGCGWQDVWISNAALAVTGRSASSGSIEGLKITTNGFIAYYYDSGSGPFMHLNRQGRYYNYIALR